MSEELKPCPFCGGTDIDPAFARGYEAGDVQKPELASGCMDCSSTGPMVKHVGMTGYMASIKAWNTRANDKEGK